MTEPAKETVIIVHGTFAAPKPGVSRWYHPGEGLSATKGFVTKLDAALQERGSQARCWAHCDQDDPGFYWSGNNSWVARSQAAAELGSYVLDLRNKGWCCHIVAHSHGGNVVLEALQQITTSLPSSAPLGKIATLGTPFMHTIAPILQRISRTRSLSVGLSWIALVWLMLLIPIAVAFNGLGFDEKGTTIGTIIAFLAPAIGFTLFTFGRNSQTEPICCPLAQEQPKFLAIGSRWDEPWQLLHHMRDARNPMAVQTSLVRYLISSMRSQISRRHQVSRIYDAKSYSDVKLAAKLSLALTHLTFLLCISVPLMLILTEITLSITAFTSSVAHGTPVTFAVAEAFAVPFPALEWAFEVQSLLVLSWFVLLLLFTRMFGPTFYSAFFSPLRWCAYRLTAITGIFRLIATYVVRNRSWSVALAIAMGLEGYRHELPRIEKYPSSVSGNFVTYEDMPKGAEQRALARRGAWIDRHLNDAAQTFSKLVVTSAEIKLLLRAIEADPDLVHAAYYTDDDCIARVADWIAAKDGVHSNAAVARPQRVEMQVASLATPSFFQP